MIKLVFMKGCLDRVKVAQQGPVQWWW